MNLPEFEYKGLMAQAWDVLRGDTSNWPDRAFYLDVIAKFGQPVLDVGCGTGRLLLDYLQEGIDIDGVDNSRDMLKLCREKARTLKLKPNLTEQYMEMLDLPRKYKTILVPSSSLQLVIEPDTLQRTMERLSAHLLPGGVLVASFMSLWNAGDPLESTWEKEMTRESDGVTFRRIATSRFDPATDLEDTEDLYQVLSNGHVIAEEKHSRAPATRSYTQAQARALFENAGLDEVDVLHEFTWEPVRPEDWIYVVMGLKPIS